MMQALKHADWTTVIGAWGALALLLLMVQPPLGAEPLPNQILIEAQIWELSDDRGFDWGVIWDYNKKESSKPGDFDIFSFDLRLPVFDESTEVPPKGFFISGDVFDLRYGIMNLRIQAALREGQADLLANPKVVVVNGKTATIHTGEEVPIIKFAYDKDGRQTLNTVFLDTGVKLKVRPDIHETSPEFVILNLRPEVNEIVRFEKLTSPDGEFELPLLTTRSAQSKVLVRSGETLIMGGLYQEQTIQLERGVPGLKNIPVAGALFRSRTQTKEKRDLLIEIRPTILLPGNESFIPAPITSRPGIGGATQTEAIFPRYQGLPSPIRLPKPEYEPSRPPDEGPPPAKAPAASRKEESPSTQKASGSWY